MTDSPHDARYLQGIEYFNECDFFEAHEIWEELWTELQGGDLFFVTAGTKATWEVSEYVRKAFHFRSDTPVEL